MFTRPVPQRGTRNLTRIAAAFMFGAVLLINNAPTPANAAGTGRVIASPNLVIRNTPSTSGANLGSVPYGTTVTIACTTRGTSVTGPYGATTLWDKVTYSGRTGYVSDAFIYTGTSAAVTGPCTTAPSSTVGQRVASYASGQVGATGWNGWCEKFVENAWNRTGVYASAIAHYNAVRSRVSTQGTPPAGAIVFYAAAPINGNYGHVMISLGNDTYVTSAATVRVVNRSWPGAQYLGWYMPAWPGR